MNWRVKYRPLLRRKLRSRWKVCGWRRGWLSKSLRKHCRGYRNLKNRWTTVVRKVRSKSLTPKLFLCWLQISRKCVSRMAVCTWTTARCPSTNTAVRNCYLKTKTMGWMSSWEMRWRAQRTKTWWSERIQCHRYWRWSLLTVKLEHSTCRGLILTLQVRWRTWTNYRLVIPNKTWTTTLVTRFKCSRAH